jgi:single-strand DNA-binding protein
MSLAKVTLVGNLGRDPETRYTPNGRMNVSFSVATNRRWNDAGGNLQENTTWFRITAWGRLAETLDKLTQQGALTKGREVLVTGNIEQREWTGQDGQTRSNLEVTADDVRLIGGQREGGGEFGGPMNQGRGGDIAQPDDSAMDDVPF